MMEINSSRKLLFVLPEGFNAEEFRTTRASLRRRGINGHVASTTSEKIEGGIDYYIPDFTLENVPQEEYDGVIFFGGPGVDSIANHPKAKEIAQRTKSKGGLVCAIGSGVAVLAAAGLISGTRVTGDPEMKEKVKGAGAKYTGGQVEPRWLRGNRKGIVTALDAGASLRFGNRIARDLGL